MADARAFPSLDLPEFAAGSVWLVGAGPGDPELLTVKALKLLKAADVVVHDRLAPQPILDLAGPDARLIDVGKRKSRHTLPQDDINRLLVALALEGLKVVRLKGGDPFVFGRGGRRLRYRRRGRGHRRGDQLRLLPPRDFPAHREPRQGTGETCGLR